MNKPASASEIVDSYMSGHYDQMVKQIDEGIEMCVLIDHSIHRMTSYRALQLLKQYFSMKSSRAIEEQSR